MKTILRRLGWLLLAIAGLAFAAYAVAWGIARSRYEKVWVAHEAAFPIPFPLEDAELEALRAERIAAGADPADPLSGVDLDAVALERAVARGEHLVASRVTCSGCHGADFGGGVIVDIPVVARWVAPNLTGGKGSVTANYTASDWDHAVRHGLRRGGRASSMPSVDFVNLSDRELSDVVAYIASQPEVDRDPGLVRFGPVFSFLVALDAYTLTAATVDHQETHAVYPPEAAPTAAFGRHLAQVCRGCHGDNLSGGKLQGDPNMPIVANITPHETGLRDWSEDDFMRAMREGKRRDGSPISEYMPWKSYRQMSDAELGAIYAYLRTVPARTKGGR